MVVSTTRLTAILASFVLVACAKSGITQDQAVLAAETPVVTQDYSSEAFFPYQKPVDQFTQASLVSNPNDAVRFRLSFYPRENAPRMVVTVNGVTVTSGFTVSSNQLIFQPQPAPNAKITASYDPENPNDVMATNVMIIPGSMDLQSLRVLLNGVLVKLSDLGLSMNEAGNYVFDPSMLLFNYDDPYNLYNSQGLDVRIFGSIVVSP